MVRDRRWLSLRRHVGDGFVDAQKVHLAGTLLQALAAVAGTVSAEGPQLLSTWPGNDKLSGAACLDKADAAVFGGLVTAHGTPWRTCASLRGTLCPSRERSCGRASRVLGTVGRGGMSAVLSARQDGAK